MKKKNLKLSKKLFLNKEVIGSLDQVKGGIAVTKAIVCIETRLCPINTLGDCNPDTVSICNDACAVTRACPVISQLSDCRRCIVSINDPLCMTEL